MTYPSRAPRWGGPVLILAVTALIIGLIWFAALSAVAAHNAASRARVEIAIRGKADHLADELRRELLVTDQTLHILELEWEHDPEGFDFDSWTKRVLALTDISLQVFMADEHGIVRRSSRPAIIGDDISNRDYFRHGKALAADDERVFIGSLTQGMVTRKWQINLARRLDSPNQSFRGIIAASLDVSAFSRLQQGLNLGTTGFLAISADDGTIRWVGNPRLRATNLSVAGSPIFKAMRMNGAGTWTGRSPLDGIDRIMAYASVPDYRLQVLIGEARHDAMAAAETWERNAIAFTTVATLLFLTLAGALLWVEHLVRGRHAAVLRDRTVLAKANQQLELAESREHKKATLLEATLGGMSDGIMMVDADLRLLAWNSLFPEFTGVPTDILRVGLGMEEILRAQAAAGEFGPVDIECEVQRRLLRLRQGISVGVIERSRPDGRILEIRRNLLPGGGFVTLYSDITSRRSAENRALRIEAMAAIGRFTAGIAHDFRNLLAAISGNAEMLRGEFPDESRGARRASIICRAADRGAQLIGQLLAFARQQALAPQPMDVNVTLEGISELLRTLLGSRIITEMRLCPDLWPALVDPVQIEHVILNLVVNARDAMPDGGRLVIATANFSAEERLDGEDLAKGDYVVIDVKDTGIGMTDEVLRNAFEPFFTTKPPGRGSGLGLSQVYGVARQSGGGVRIHSESGVGTTVQVFLPRAVVSSDPEPETVASPVKPVEVGH